jgi:GTP-binding protein
MQFTVAIVGRANVGKSTLFNRLLERPKAMVSSIAGTTRDRNYGQARWRGRDFELIDTGGLEDDKISVFDIKKQADIAIKRADLVLFLVDLKAGLMPQDRTIAKTLQKLKKTIILVGNKADSTKFGAVADDPEWLKLGFGKPMPVSAANGAGTGDLLDEIFNFFKKESPKKKAPEKISTVEPIKVALVGKPNAGKSSLLNALLGEERVLVSDIPFTTREPQDITLLYRDQPLLLIDTVGMRKKAKIAPGLEKIGVKRSIAAIERADIVLFVTETQKQMTSQDKHLSELILEKTPGLIIIANKWDLIKKQGPQTINLFIDYYRRFFPYLNWAPILFISAKTGEKVGKIFDAILTVKKNREKFLDRDELKNFLNQTLAKHWSIIHRKKKPSASARPNITGLVQKDINPPRFELITTAKTRLPEGFVKFIEKRLREKFDFIGTPIKLEVKHLKKQLNS